MSKHLERDLTILQRDLLSLAGRVEEAIHKAIQALQERDPELAQEVIDGDAQIDALKDFEGAMLFVSHDRTFLRGLSTRVLELGGETGTDLEPHVYPGSYVEYVARTGHEAPGVHH